MDFALRCNALKCRQQLSDRAVVTTCSHIFCVRCSDALGLSNAANDERMCPACETRLANADDVVATELNPSEDYKTSVLSGLGPTVIMECAGRGLAFYNYQATQEIVYQQFLAKSLTDKYTNLGSQMDQIINDANTEIVNLRNKISSLELDHENLQRNNDNLMDAYNQKTRSQQKNQKAFDALKKRMLQSDAQHAATDAVEQTLRSNNRDQYDDIIRTLPKPFRHAQKFPIDERGVEQVHSRQKAGSSGIGENSRMSFQAPRAVYDQPWGTQAVQTAIMSTPSQQRTRLPLATPRTDHTSYANHSQNSDHRLTFTSSQPSVMARQPLGHINTNSVGNLGASAYGMSAGMKMSRPDRVLERGGGTTSKTNMSGLLPMARRG